MRTIDQGLTILTGIVTDGRPDSDNVNELVSKRLKELVLGLKEFSALGHDGSVAPKP